MDRARGKGEGQDGTEGRGRGERQGKDAAGGEIWGGEGEGRRVGWRKVRHAERGKAGTGREGQRGHKMERGSHARQGKRAREGGLTGEEGERGPAVLA